MPLFALLFLTGILCSFNFAFIPSLGLLLVSALSLLVLLFFAPNAIRYAAVIGLGCCWSLLHATFLMKAVLPSVLENQPIVIEGMICSIPVKSAQVTRFDFRVSKINHQKRFMRIRLSANRKKIGYPLMVGDRWRFRVRLKRPHSLMNPASFDLEKIFFQKQLQASGVILSAVDNIRLDLARWACSIQQLRAQLLTKILNLFSQQSSLGILVALTLGITDFITPRQWQVFQATGTNHLIAISGLHIGLVAVIAYKICNLIWGLYRRGPLIVPTPYISVCVSFLAVLGYSLMAGFSPSTARAFWMIAYWSIGLFIHRPVTPLYALSFALIVSVLINPFVTLAIGFWLSFLAVFLLIYGCSGRVLQTGRLWRWWRPQWVATIGMVPLILHFFQQASLLAIPVNLVAIPWVSFVVVPTCLLGICLLAINKQLGQFCLQLAIYLIDILWRFLEQSAKYSFLIWHMALPEGLGCWITFLAGYISLLPKYICPPLIALSCWLPGLIPLPNTLSNKQLQLVVFDVGQGLATMVRTKHHTLIFDTGAKLSEVFDMGKGVIVPYLLKYGIKKIDILAISHGDNDHIGGAKSLLDSVPVTRIYTSVPERFSYISERIPVAYCQENMSWQWDGVQFKFLSPFRGAPFKGNNLSCVLKVTQGSHSLLLTGDIEKKAEEQLVKRHGNELAASILVAPHHGSKTSSSLNFIYKVMPAMTIFACGYLNSYHHPHPSTIKNYQRINVELYNTVKDGAITMTLVRDSDKVQVQKYRQQHQKLWHQLYSTNPAKP